MKDVATPKQRRTSPSTLPEELAERITASISKEIAPYIERLSEAVRRAVALVKAAQAIDDSSVRDDILRAVVVLNHAYLEDVLRTLAATLLPECNEQALNEIPLVGFGSIRPEKFFLGKLLQHKGKLVDDVIRESISQFLERSTFNNVDEIAHLVTTLGFNVNEFRTEFPKLSAMMQRRHLIVHRADRSKANNSDAYSLQRIDAIEVLTWLQAMGDFIRKLLLKMCKKTYTAKKLADMGIRLTQE